MNQSALELYKLNWGALSSQYTRLLTRFNYFLTVETALFGFVGWLLFERHQRIGRETRCAAGMFKIGILWVMMLALRADWLTQFVLP